MKAGTSIRLGGALLMLGLFGGVTAAGAQEEGSGPDTEYGVGLYLGNCDSLVEGAALYDLADVELETEDFSGGDENQGDETPEGQNLEEELEDESNQDETDVEGAIDGSTDQGSSDEEVVVQDSNFLVWVASGEGFGADLGQLVDAPFAIAIRSSAQDDTGSDEEGDDFLACGTFGGAVAGNELVIPLRGLNDSGFSGVAILEAGEGEGESLSSVYLFREGSTDELGGGDEGEGEVEGTPEA